MNFDDTPQVDLYQLRNLEKLFPELTDVNAKRLQNLLGALQIKDFGLVLKLADAIFQEQLGGAPLDYTKFTNS